ncbi:hypothetical protein BQ8420_15450 [Nocardiopsis sp. JB363]|nr:hypothetical protein BQ8420_15450 [Nocardiopsis sp. JB363]
MDLLHQERGQAAREVHGAQVWCPHGVPPLLQTADYARCVLRSHALPQDMVEQLVDVRMMRVSQVAAQRHIPARYEAVLTRTGYEHPPAGATNQIMAQQWAQLADLGALAHVRLRVLPAAEHHRGAGGLGGFSLYPDGSACTTGPEGPRPPLEGALVARERFAHLWQLSPPYPG